MKTLKSFSTYTLISIITAGIPFLLMPFLTHYLSTNDYGKLSLFNTYVTILIPLISLGSTGYISLQFFKQKKRRFTKIFSSIIRIPVITSIIFLLFTFLFKDWLEGFLELNTTILFLLPIVAFLTVIADLLYTMLIFQKKPHTYGIVSITKTIIEVSCSLLFIISFKFNWEGRVYSWLIVAILIVFYSLYYFKNQEWIDLKIYSHQIAKQSLIFGLPLVPHIIGKFVINQSDTLFIAKMASIEELGVYRIGYQFGLITSIISGAFLSVYNPFLFERLAKIDDKKKAEIIKISYLFIFVLAIATIIISLSSSFIFHWFIHQDFANGVQYVFWTSLAYFFWGGYLIFAGYLFYLKKTSLLSYLSIFNVVVNLALNYILINRFGVIGVSYATTISFFCTFVIVAYLSNKHYPMPWFRSNKTKS